MKTVGKMSVQHIQLLFTHNLVPWSNSKTNLVSATSHKSNTPFTLQTEANRCEPYCRIHTIHTSTEGASMRIPQFDSILYALLQ